jgi:hypothetical protein
MQRTYGALKYMSQNQGLETQNAQAHAYVIKNR